MTLAQARAIDPNEYLVIYCVGAAATGPGCHHAGEMTVLHALTLWGENARLDELPLKCSHCGSRQVDVRTSHPRGVGGRPIG